MPTGTALPKRLVPAITSTPGVTPPARRARRAWAVLAHVAFALVGLFAPSLASAQGLGRANLFNHDNLPAGDGATNEVAAHRARFIRVNSPLLTIADSPIHQPAPPELNLDSSRLELNLFSDVTLTAAFEKTLYRNGTNFFATGLIDGWENSRVMLVVEGEIVAANIDVPGLGSYQVRYVGSGLHKVIELDKEQVPSCGP